MKRLSSNNLQQALNLLDQLIETAIYKDRIWKNIHKQQHKASQSIGDDSIVFHLRQLKTLLESDSDQNNVRYPPPLSHQQNTFIVCSG